MIAFVLPLMWIGTGLTVAGTLSRFSSRVGMAATGFEMWKLKKMVSLGIHKDLVQEPERTEDEQMLREIARGDGSKILDDEFRPFVYEFQHEDPDIAGTYAFVSVDEFRLLANSIRQYNLLSRRGPEADRLREKLKGTTIQYGELSFLWDDSVMLFSQMKRMSKDRLGDSMFRKLAGLDATL